MRVLPVMPRKIHLMDVPEGITPAPEGALIRQARTALWPPISATAAAKKAGISPSRWQTVERGYIARAAPPGTARPGNPHDHGG